MPNFWYSSVPGTDAWVSSGWGSIFGTAMSTDDGQSWTMINDTKGRQISFWNNSIGYLAGNEGGDLSFFRWVGPPFELTTGVLENSLNSFGYYPNPAADAITVTGVGSMAIARIFTTTGQLVIQSPVGANGRVALGQLERGAYILELTEGDRVQRSRLVKE